MVYIYTLSELNGVRYVGKTTNPKQRAKKHIIEAKSGRYNNHRINWIVSLINKGELPIMEVIDVVPETEWAFWERYWISQFKTWGFNLVNGTDGGENPPSWRGKTHSVKYKEIRREIMLSDKNPAKNMDDEWRKNISNSLKGRVFSEEHKIKLGNPIIQLSLNGDVITKWSSASIASRELKINKCSILACVRGERKSAGKFKWINDYGTSIPSNF